MSGGLFPVEVSSTPISLYFDFNKDSPADLETVARAALAWSASLHAIFENLEPSLSLKIQIVDGDEGSLWLNTLLRLEEALDTITKGGEQFPRLWALAKGFAIIVVATPLSITAEDVWRSLINERPELIELSEESRKAIVRDLEKALKDNVAPKEKENFFREIQKSPSINAIGVSSSPKVKPDFVTSRQVFELYLERGTEEEALSSTRKREEIMDVELVSPVLKNAERSWRFIRPGLPEFGAVMKDELFRDAVARGGVHEELREGIPMTIRIQFKEKKIGPLWHTEERSVLEVISPSYDRGGLGLDFPAQ